MFSRRPPNPANDNAQSNPTLSRLSRTLRRGSSVLRVGCANVCFWPIVLQKSFCALDHKISDRRNMISVGICDKNAEESWSARGRLLSRVFSMDHSKLATRVVLHPYALVR